MKFLLAETRYGSFSSPGEKTAASRNWRGTVFQRQLEFGAKLKPKDGYLLERRQKRKKKQECEKLCQKLINNFRANHKNSGPDSELQFWKLNLEMGVSEIPSEDAEGKLKGYVKLKGLFKDNCLEGLRDLSNGKAKIHIKVSVSFPDAIDNLEFVNSHIRTAELSIKGKETAQCQDWTIAFPTNYLANWKSESVIAMCTVRLSLPVGVLTNAFQVRSNNRKLLKDGTLSDVTIIAANGTRIKAHQAFLAAQSPVFQTMFQSDMNENRERVVNIPDISEEGIRALLRYLYCSDTNAAKTNSQVLFELFYAGHKYDINGLETAMREVIAKTPSEKYDVEEILGLFLFARNLTPKDDELMKKSVQVLSLHSSKLEESPMYQELFTKDPAAAMDLCRHALNTCSFKCATSNN